MGSNSEFFTKKWAKWDPIWSGMYCTFDCGDIYGDRSTLYTQIYRGPSNYKKIHIFHQMCHLKKNSYITAFLESTLFLSEISEMQGRENKIR